jgi:hypothetical protein
MPQRLAAPEALRDAWAHWLSERPWDLFLTLTSEHRTHPESLHKRFGYCVHKISDELYGRAVTRRRCLIEYVNGIERHKSGWPHSHAVLRLPGVDLAERTQFSLEHWQKFISDTGGWCWLQRPRSQGDVVSYVTKYVVKDGELVLSDNLEPTSDPTPPLDLTRRPVARAAVGVTRA